ncbi:SDR family oxidoreductase [Primorskyibacter sp. 2E233]|uniref:SDR family oxidoreductase n=1 Tax=Primorskyibacter sp. 2E233 TaxID=3413431 RepID=UPI003BF35776
MNDLTGKTALVTGASSGIGRAVARTLARNGVRVALTGRSKQRLDQLAAELGPEHPVIPADLAIPSELDRMIEQAETALGGIDILHANAGLYLPGDLIDSDPEQIEATVQVNVTAVFRCVRRVLPGMIERGGGEIVVTSSVAGHQAIQWEPVYSASKHAVQAFVHGVRRQVSKHHIRVGALAPGIVLNELWGAITPEEIERQVAARAGLRCEDVAEAFMFMITRPANVTVRDLVLLPADQDI